MAIQVYGPGYVLELLEIPQTISSVDVGLRHKNLDYDACVPYPREEYDLTLSSPGGFSIRNLRLITPDGKTITINHLYVTEFRITGKCLPEFDPATNQISMFTTTTDPAKEQPNESA